MKRTPMTKHEIAFLVLGFCSLFAVFVVQPERRTMPDTLYIAVEPCGCATGAAVNPDLLHPDGRRILEVERDDPRLKWIGCRCGGKKGTR